MHTLLNAGVPHAHAEVQIELLLEAELRGRASHGLQRLPRVIERIRNGVSNPVTRGTSHWLSPSQLDVDGEHGLGPVVAFAALEQIALRAKSNGIAIASVRNCNHIGMLALYAERMAQQGQILIAMTTSEAVVHPWGGRKAMIGTNPIAIGVPASPSPFVLDMATSAVSMGQIHDYANRGEALDSGWALDAHGEPTLDAHAARDGAIAPFGDAKGYALGLAIEVLVANLTGSALGGDVRGTIDSEHPCNKGDVFIVIEPQHSMSGPISNYLQAIRDSDPKDASKPVLVPGDRAFEARKKSIIKGVTLPESVWERICDLASM